MQFSNLTPELSALIWSVILLFVTIMAQQLYTDATRGHKFALSDRLSGHTSDVARRFDRTVRNTLESLAMFTPVVLVLAITEISTTGSVRGAWLFLLARVVYAVAYPINIPLLRSVAWMAGLVGIWMCLWPILF